MPSVTFQRSGNRTIHISDEVLCKVAAIATQSVEGVARLASTDKILSHLQTQPIRTQHLDGAVELSVRIVLGDGAIAVQTAKNVQRAVKQSVQDMTGITAVHVNVEICGIDN